MPTNVQKDNVEKLVSLRAEIDSTAAAIEDYRAMLDLEAIAEMPRRTQSYIMIHERHH